MCDLQMKLVAWLDRELPTDEASEVERHVKVCEGCRHRATTYGAISETLEAYCDTLMATNAPRRVAPWVPVLATALLAASVLLFLILRPRVVPRPVVEPMVAASTLRASERPPAARPAPHKATIHARRAAQRVQEHTTPKQPMDTTIQIAIPAEAMFPPGAMPNGIKFIADLKIAPDGSVKQVRLRQ